MTPNVADDLLSLACIALSRAASAIDQCTTGLAQAPGRGDGGTRSGDNRAVDAGEHAAALRALGRNICSALEALRPGDSPHLQVAPCDGLAM